MKTPKAPTPPAQRKAPQTLLRNVIELCADCDTCRLIMDQDCAFFPELYRLWDLEMETGVAISDDQQRALLDLCTLCGLCPCPKIPMEMMEAKSRYIAAEGLPIATRLITDVPRLARLCGILPQITAGLQENRVTGTLLRKAVDMHPDRHFPTFPKENFFQWANTKGLSRPSGKERHISYFAGCTAGYLFPQIGQALVKIMEHNNIGVRVPPQDCCGMPYLVEGDKDAVLQRTQENMKTLLKEVEVGDDLITTCPTCGFFMKKLLPEGAYFSAAYQTSVNAAADELKVPEPGRGVRQHKLLKKMMYGKILKDDGYFSSLDPLGRIAVAEHFYDAGEYLQRLHDEGHLNTEFAEIPERMVYFAPCHQREQNIGRPYLDLLALIPELKIEQLGETECCGMGGNFGFKAGFHEQSLTIGKALAEKIRKQDPEGIITDCMSCRLQFNHLLPYPVYHPLELLARASSPL